MTLPGAGRSPVLNPWLLQDSSFPNVRLLGTLARSGVGSGPESLSSPGFCQPLLSFLIKELSYLLFCGYLALRFADSLGGRPSAPHMALRLSCQACHSELLLELMRGESQRYFHPRESTHLILSGHERWFCASERHRDMGKDVAAGPICALGIRREPSKMARRNNGCRSHGI